MKKIIAITLLLSALLCGCSQAMEDESGNYSFTSQAVSVN